MRLLPLLGLSMAAMLLSGCTSSFVNDLSAGGTPATSKLASLQGSVYGGQQPIEYASVQIWQVGANGYGSGATALIPSGSYYLGGASGCVASASQVCYAGVETTAVGAFHISGDYTCTTGAELYLTSIGGQPSPGSANSAIALMLGFAPCGPSNASATLNINEVTTVGTVYALAPFMPATPNGTPWTVGSSSGNAIGLTNGFSDIGTLVQVSNGSANASTATTTLPTAEINSIANALASCVNSTGSTSGGCTALFGQTPNADGSTPTDTVSALLNIVRNPGRNVQKIIAAQGATPPFQPSLSSATDLTLAVTYMGNGISAPSSVAIDASGNVWVANKGTSAATSSVTELSHAGAVLSGATGYTAGSLNLPSAIAIDTNGNAWIANSGNSTLTELTASGANVSGSPYSGGGLSTPSGVAIDASGNVWLSNGGSSSVSEFSSGGTVLSGSGFTGSGIGIPIGIAINPH